MKPIPTLEIKWIDVLRRHVQAFGVPHALEGTAYLISELGIESSPIEEIYTLTERSLGTVHINVTTIRRAFAKYSIPFRMLECTLNESWYRYTMESSGVEEDGITRIIDLDIPGIMIAWDEDMSHTTIVDGNHRLCRRWRDGLKTFECAIVPRYLVEEHIQVATEMASRALNISDLITRRK